MTEYVLIWNVSLRWLVCLDQWNVFHLIYINHFWESFKRGEITTCERSSELTFNVQSDASKVCSDATLLLCTPTVLVSSCTANLGAHLAAGDIGDIGAPTTNHYGVGHSGRLTEIGWLGVRHASISGGYTTPSSWCVIHIISRLYL